MPRLVSNAARFVPTAAGLLAFAFFAWLWESGAHEIYTRVLTIWGFIPYKFPFLDISASLAAWDCARQGVDVFVSDPCDVLHLPYNYSPLWISIDWIPLGRSDRNAVGIVLDTAFFLSLSCLPAPLSRSELIIRLLTTFSTMTCFAVERVNVDILVFIIIMPAIFILRRPGISRAIGYGLLFLAGAIKYYPFILLGLIFREKPRQVLRLTAIASAGFLLFLYTYYSEIIETLHNIPTGSPFADFYSARNFSKGIFMLAMAATSSAPFAFEITAVATSAAALLLMLLLAYVWRNSHVIDSVKHLNKNTRLFLVSGAMLLCGCFFLVQNITYRGIFILLLVPGLCALGRDRNGGAFGRLARVLSIGIVPLMFSTPLLQLVYHVAKFLSRDTGHSLTITVAAYFVAWCSREATWWILICFLCLVMIGDFLNAPVFEMLKRRKTAPVPP